MTRLDEILKRCEAASPEFSAVRVPPPPKPFETIICRFCHSTNARTDFPLVVEALKKAVEALERLKGIGVPSISTGDYQTADYVCLADLTLTEIEKILK